MRPPRQLPRPRACRALLASRALPFLLLALAACGDGDDLATGPDGPGVVVVSVATTGSSPDPDGYEVLVDDVAGPRVEPSGSVTLPDVTVGTHRIGLATTSLVQNCAVAGENPQAVDVTPGDTARVAFTVACTARGSPPSITAIDGPVVADNVPGTVTTFTITFADPDGDVARLAVVAESDPSNAIEPDSVELDVRASAQGRTSGTIEHTITCSAVPPDFCGAGPVTLRFRLVDAEGGSSEPRTHAMAFGIGSSPAITTLEAPERTGTARGTRTRIRIGFSDPDGDLQLVRLQEVSDTGDAVDAEGTTIGVATQAGTATTGTVDVDFICQVPLGRSCPAGTATLRIVLVDRESNSSAPREATIVFAPGTGGGSAPVIVRLAHPATISTVSGSAGEFRIAFADADGDLTTVRIEERSDPDGAFAGDVALDVLPQTAGLETGEILIALRCDAPAGSECASGRVGLRFALVDAQANASVPSDVEIEFVSPGAGGAGPAGVERATMQADAIRDGGPVPGNAKNPRGQAPRVFRR